MADNTYQHNFKETILEMRRAAFLAEAIGDGLPRTRQMELFTLAADTIQQLALLCDVIQPETEQEVSLELVDVVWDDQPTNVIPFKFDSYGPRDCA